MKTVYVVFDDGFKYDPIVSIHKTREGAAKSLQEYVKEYLDSGGSESMLQASIYEYKVED